MPSPSAINFRLGIDRALILHKVVNDPRLRPQSRQDSEAICHATLAAATAAWNFYVGNVVRDFHSAIANPTDIRYNNATTAWKQLAENAIAKFNTPNADNSRSLLSLYTGYDPINDWVWPQKGLGGPQVRDLLNEILKVRHSFAHGFAIPAYSWTQSSIGQIRLGKTAVNMALSFFRNMVARTDRGLSGHLSSIYSTTF